MEYINDAAPSPFSVELPPPTVFRPKSMTAMVSARSPFQILDISQGLSTLLGYSPQQASLRSISLLSGPDTDQRALSRAIAQAAADQTTTASDLSVYDRNGSCHAVRIVCTPCPDVATGAVSACRLTLELSAPACAWRVLPPGPSLLPPPLSPTPSPAPSGPAQPPHQDDRRAQRGLAVLATRRSALRQLSPPAWAAASGDSGVEAEAEAEEDVWRQLFTGVAAP
jgi:hypothetical protein